MLSDEWQVRPVAEALPPAPPRLPRIEAPYPSAQELVTGLSVQDLRTVAEHLSLEQFRRQVGPFALVQRPPTPVVTKLAIELGAQATGGRLSDAQSSELFVALMMEFEHLAVAALPPLRGDDELYVGRLPDCDLVLDDPSVSKRHAVLRWDSRAERCRVCDLRSTNGTSVNGLVLRSREAPLNDGDLLMFGDASFLFLVAPTLYGKLLNRPAAPVA